MILDQHAENENKVNQNDDQLHHFGGVSCWISLSIFQSNFAGQSKELCSQLLNVAGELN